MELPRQPLPVTIIIVAHDERDATFWYRQLEKKTEYKGDLLQQMHATGLVQSFKIHPRAIND